MIGVVSYVSVVRLKENATRVEHTHEVLSSLELLLAAATDSETAERGYVITGDEGYLEPYRQAGAVVDGQTKRLRELTADNRAQQQARLGGCACNRATCQFARSHRIAARPRLCSGAGRDSYREG